MAQLKNVLEPFGEVNVFRGSTGKFRIRATILMEPYREGAQTGIALDGSGSMANLYGASPMARVSPALAKKGAPNLISPVAQQICAYLARKVDADGGTTCIYWAVGSGGSEVEVVGDLKAEQAEQHTFGPPKNFGTGTRLLPAVKYFAERFADAPWGFYVFITDGEIHDLEDVKRYTKSLAVEISAKRRNPLKFVLVGLGSDVNERQMEELDDLETGTSVDLWDHKLASELRVLEQIFAEVVDENARIAEKGRILDAKGNVLKDYSDTGVPGVLEFEIPTTSDYFALEVNGNRFYQAIADNVAAPPHQLAAETAKATPVIKEIPKSRQEEIVDLPAPTPQPKKEDPNLDNITEVRDDLSSTLTEGKKEKEQTRDADEWLGFDLEMDKKTNDVDLEKNQ